MIREFRVIRTVTLAVGKNQYLVSEKIYFLKIQTEWPLLFDSVEGTVEDRRLYCSFNIGGNFFFFEIFLKFF